MAIAQPMPETRSRLGRAWDALRARDTAAQAVPSGVSFAEVVWAHHQRQQKEVFKDAREGDWHDEYERRLRLFCAQHGEIIEAYWCRYEASGVALTERRRPRRLTNLYRSDSILRLHTATDWRTANAPVIASTLHRWQTAAIKASEVLRDTSERIALHRIFAASTQLLAFVDRKRDNASITDADLALVVRDHEHEIDDVNDYYARAGENAARIVYFRGMMWGTALLALLVGGAFLAAWWLDWIDPHDEPTYTLFVSIGMGGAGAVLSVMTRMARQGGFSLEFEVGRKSMRYLGGIRPWIGALSALVIYLAIKSELLEFLPNEDKGIYFYATIAFVSGFSERRAKVLIGGIGYAPDGHDGGGDGPDDGNGGARKRGGGPDVSQAERAPDDSARERPGDGESRA
jgi:hypothetical protein